MNEKINFQDLITLLAEKCNITRKESELFLKEYFHLLSEGLLEEQIVKVKNLGTFKLTSVNPRESIDVNNGTRVVIPAHYKINYTPDSQLADEVNEPFSFFESVEINESIPEAIEEQSNVEDSVESTLEVVTEAFKDEEIVEAIPEAIQKEEVIKDSVNTVSEVVAEAVIDAEPVELIPVVNLKESSAEKNHQKKISPGKSSENKSKTLIYLGLGFFVGIALMLAGYFYFRNINNFDSIHPQLSHNEELSDIFDVMMSDTLVNKEDIENNIPDEETLTDSVISNKNETVQVIPVAPSVKTPRNTSVKKRTIEPGERLTLIALQEYGHKSFWVYLYEENVEKISDPNNVKAGTQIIIPPASKYNINKKDPESIKRANKLAEKYLN